MSLLRIIVASSVLALASPAIAQDAPGRVQTAEESIRADAQFYARMHGVDIEEAVRRLNVQESSADAVARMRETYGGRLAGIFYEHSPQYRLVVRLTGTEAVPSTTIGSGGLRVDFVTGAGATLAQLQSAIASNLGRLGELVPTIIGLGADERTGEIAIDVRGTAVQAPGIQAQRTALQTLLGHPVRLRVIDAVPQGQTVRGGALFEYCTAGFVAKNGTRTGLLTAAHCPDNLIYSDPATGDQHTLAMTTERDDASHDVQWHDATGLTVGHFYGDSASVSRALLGRRYQSSTTVGQQVCHRGAATDYSCGSVENIAFQPYPSQFLCGPSNNLTCSNTWVQVGGSTVRCAEGDSGGPWFLGQTAYGIHSAGTVYVSTGQCVSAWYMSTDRITGMGSGFALLYAS